MAAPKKGVVQVASPGAAAAPLPPGSNALEAPWPQFRVMRWRVAIAGPVGLERERFRVSWTAVTVALAGRLERSKAIKPRRMGLLEPRPARPMKKCSPAPLLIFPARS